MAFIQSMVQGGNPVEEAKFTDITDIGALEGSHIYNAGGVDTITDDEEKDKLVAGSNDDLYYDGVTDMLKSAKKLEIVVEVMP